MMDITIKPLVPALADEYLKFFDGPAFSDNPEWAGCYCCFYHICSPQWEERSGEQNREFAREAIERRALNGYLAFIDNEPVGWVNAGARENYARLAGEPLPGGSNICSVVCFTISPLCRRQGIAAKLLQAVTDGARGKYDYIEAYPLKGEQTAAFHYHGPLAMYENAGFEKTGETEEYYIVRRKL
jgi:ribosomal protein S18 acetylase RimI-like enzyme